MLYLFTKEYSKNSLTLKCNPDDTQFNGNIPKARILPSKGFHKAMAPAFILFQCCGLMPVRGITSKDPRSVAFAWCSFRALFSFALFIAAGFHLVLLAIWGFAKKLVFTCRTGVLGLALMSAYIAFFRLARKWPSLIVEWESVERMLPYSGRKDVLARKIKYILIAAMIIVCVDHSLKILDNITLSNDCFFTESDAVENFFQIAHGHVFYTFSYYLPLGVFTEITFFFFLFSWNCIYIFLILISLGLSSNFKQLNYSLLKVKGKQTTPLFWKEHRIHYQNVCNLCKKINEAVSTIAMFAMLNILLDIFNELLDTFSDGHQPKYIILNFVSLTFLLLRLLAIALSSAGIGDESKIPLRVLRSVPSESWCLEIERFQQEVRSAKTELSAMGFFHLNRAMVLNALGISITFELILIQYGVFVDIEARGCHVNVNKA